MNVPQIDFPRLRRHLNVRWRRLTRGTTRAAGVVICVPMLCAVVVGGSQVMPFVRAHELPASSDASRTDNAGEEPLSATDASIRQLTKPDYNESWLQAGTDWDRLGDVSRRHQALVTPEGRLSGRLTTFADWRGDVQPLTEAAVHLMQGGHVAAETTTDAEGRFTADGLSEGTYSLIAESPAGLLAYALHVRTAMADEAAGELQLESMATTAWDTPAVLDRVLAYWQSDPPIERTREPETERVPDAVRPIAQEGSPATTLWSHRVRLQSDGRLIGRLRRLHPVTGRPIIASEIEVALYRNGTLQGLTWTDDVGYFEIAHVAPGIYSLVATGAAEGDAVTQIVPGRRPGLHQGFLALGVQVLRADDALVSHVSGNDAAVLEIDAALIDIVDLVPFLGPPGVPSQPTAAPLLLSTPTGGTGFGGGGTGGGGIAPWLLAGAAAGLAAALANDDDGVISQAHP